MRILRSKELRSLVFMVVAIVMAIMLCVSSIRQFNLFSVVVSIFMLATLSVGLGYQYCKHEDRIGEIVEERRKEKEFAKKVKTEKAAVVADKPKSVKEMLAGEMPEDRVIAKIKPTLVSADKSGGSASANDSSYHQGQ